MDGSRQFAAEGLVGLSIAKLGGRTLHGTICRLTEEEIGQFGHFRLRILAAHGHALSMRPAFSPLQHPRIARCPTPTASTVSPSFRATASARRSCRRACA